jgi:hypothetical protein
MSEPSIAHREITADTIRRAVHRARTERPRVCGLDMPHVVHPRDYAAGVGVCANCGALATR